MEGVGNKFGVIRFWLGWFIDGVVVEVLGIEWVGLVVGNFGIIFFILNLVEDDLEFVFCIIWSKVGILVEDFIVDLRCGVLVMFRILFDIIVLEDFKEND